jgi:CBS domain-containing protein
MHMSCRSLRMHATMGRMDAAQAAEGQVVADLMLRNPKTLPAEAAVADARAVLDNPHVKMVLLTDGQTFVGAITDLPRDAVAAQRALDYADPSPETIGPGEPASTAFARTAANPYRRLVVVDDDAHLLGLLCVNESRTRFCATPRAG